ncbi:unnamed protein product, partial [Rotaria sp. Silwood2]
LSATVLGMAVFTFYNNYNQTEYEDSLCIFRRYMGFVSTGLQNYSYMLQAVYRYIIVVYPYRQKWISARIQAYLIICRWIFSFLYSLPLYFTGKITYDINNQICQQILCLSIGNIYNYLSIHGISNINYCIYLY